MGQLKHKQLRRIISELKTEVQEMKALFLQKVEPQPEPEEPCDIKEVSVVTRLTTPTIYGYCQRNEIPYYKKGNKLYFFKSEILDWIRTGKQKTIKEIQEDANLYLLNNKKGLNYGK
ncbi:MAG TPA: helix-turn-helix domain-containing protein [Flavobacterium sp.]